MQTMTAQIQIFHSLRGKWAKVNLFSNRVNVLRIKDNLFSMTSPLDLGRLARPRTIPTPSLHTCSPNNLTP